MLLLATIYSIQVKLLPEGDNQSGPNKRRLIQKTFYFLHESTGVLCSSKCGGYD